MNKNILMFGAVGIIIVVLVAGGMLFLNQQNTNSDKMMADKSSSDETMMQEDDTKSDDSMMMDEGDSMSEEEKMMMDKSENSRYVEYSKENLDSSSTSNRVLFFYANWCPTCRPVDQEISSNLDKIPEGMTIIRVNYNDTDTDQEEKDLAKKYNVTYQHTFVQVDEKGNEIKKWNGGGLDQILSSVN